MEMQGVQELPQGLACMELEVLIGSRGSEVSKVSMSWRKLLPSNFVQFCSKNALLLVLSVSGWWARNRNLGAETEREALFVPLIAIEEARKEGKQNTVGSRIAALPHEDRTKKTRACEEERDESR